MIRVRNAGYLYDGSDIHALEDISLVLEPGEHICVLGPNAGGKSTLAQLIAGVRFATAGEVVVDGTVLTPETAISVARNVGFVAQDPRSSMVSSLVFDEVAFGLRNLGLPSKKVAGRALGALERCGIRKLQHSSTTELSGGQQQLVSLAAALALDPAYLVLDEATTMLDGTSAKRIDALVDDLVADGVGVLEITHSILRAMGAHRIIVIDRGRMAWQGGFDALLSDDGALRVLGLDGDPTVALLRTIRAEGFSFASGCTPDDVRSYAEMHHLGYRLRSVVAPHRIAPGIAPAHELALDSVGVVYGKNVALSDLSVAIGDELVVVAGPSGSGKSTCAAVLTGILPPDEGDALLDGERVQAGRVGLAMQYPQDQLFAPTVRDDIAFGPRNLGVEGAALDAAVSSAADAMGISDLLDRNPFELSGGQARRAALAGIIALNPAAYIFDEPLSGLDAFGRRQTKALVARLRGAHAPVIIVSHDVEEWLDAASRVIFLREGRLAYDCDGVAAQTRTQPYISCGLEPPLAVAMRALSGMGSERRPQHG